VFDFGLLFSVSPMDNFRLYIASAITSYIYSLPCLSSVMSQAVVDAFVDSPSNITATPTCMTMAVVAREIPVNGRSRRWGHTALYSAVSCTRRELVVALLAAGANANVKTYFGATVMWRGAFGSTADILQLLIDSGGDVNEPMNNGDPPLLALVKYNSGDAAARLEVLLACPELNLDAACDGTSAEEWGVSKGNPELAAAIAEERRRRVRWSAVRCAWVAATAHN
jgi:hypothetical protein